MTAVFITVYRQRTRPKINEERSVQGQINQIIPIISRHEENNYPVFQDKRKTLILKIEAFKDNNCS